LLPQRPRQRRCQRSQPWDTTSAASSPGNRHTLSAGDDNGALKAELRVRSPNLPNCNKTGPAPGAPHCIVMVTPPTAADTSAPTLGPLSFRITPLAFCNCTPPAPRCERAARPARGIAAGKIPGATQIKRSANEVGRGGADRKAHAHSRYREVIVLAAKGQSPLPPPTPTMNPPLVKTTRSAPVSARLGVARPADTMNPSAAANTIPV
jgi:hypothetical protein